VTARSVNDRDLFGAPVLSALPRVEVALPLPLDRTFTYAVRTVPPPAPGTRVRVPFRGRAWIGWVMGPGEEGEIRGLREVMEVLEEEPSVTPSLLELARWIADYYLVSPGLALRSALPALLSDPSRAGGGGITRQVARLVGWLGTLEEREKLGRRAPKQLEAYSALEAAGGEEEVARLEERGIGRGAVSGLVRRGLAEVIESEVVRDPFRGAPPGASPVLVPTPDQAEAIRALVGALDDPARLPFLLQGVTGSGKTLVYLDLLEEVVVRRGEGAIVLVPEISLTPQTVSRFRARFGDRVAVLHSALSDGERHDAWRQLHRGERSIAVGARSAIFAPVHNLRAIVVDEEHDGSYKQSDAPRYHARDVAVLRAAREGAVCVLGSATPSLESWFNARAGKFRRLLLPGRPGGGELPKVRVVDLRALRPGGGAAPPMAPDSGGRIPSQGPPRAARPRRGEVGQGGSGGGLSGTGAATGEGGVILSPELVDAVRLRLERREQVILLLNRRGYSSFVQCRDCGDVRTCPNCAVSLTWHRGSGKLACHHCRHEEASPVRCIRCGSGELSYRGIGTEQVERAVAEAFGLARIARMDVDTTSGKWSHHEILGRVERGEVDILLGTQMIAKGLDFPGVTLVGVINADVGIHLPDFRASERTFQLMSQVAGRAGRGDRKGEVLIQTSIPEHYAIRCALSHDYEAFAERELAERATPAYPPLARLANIVVSSPDPERAASTAEAAVRWLRALPGGLGEVEIVGPAPAPIERLHNRWRWHFLLRSPAPGPLGRVLRAFQGGFEPPPAGDVRVAIDRDPVALL